MMNSGVYSSLFAISTGSVSSHVVADHLSVGSQRSGVSVMCASSIPNVPASAARCPAPARASSTVCRAPWRKRSQGRAAARGGRGRGRARAGAGGRGRGQQLTCSTSAPHALRQRAAATTTGALLPIS